MGQADRRLAAAAKAATLSPEPPDSLVRQTLARDGKVLWVCNTVDRVMEAAGRLADVTPLAYHSRFRYRDRVERHKAVMDAFRGGGPALAICSQVAEMSLDLSASLLVTDLPPVPALIQRLGRLNRRAVRDDAWPFVVIEPRKGDGTPAVLPYTAAELAGARRWLQVSVDEPGPVRVLDGSRQAGDQPRGPLPTERRTAEEVLQAASRTELHREEQARPALRDLMDFDDVGVARTRHSSRASARNRATDSAVGFHLTILSATRRAVSNSRAL
jgi:hypothetical protein